SMRTDAFDFELPERAIALFPATPRDAARLLLVGRSPPDREPPPRAHTGGAGSAEAEFADHQVADLPQLLQPGDVVVLNDTRVIRAALEGVRRRGENAAAISFNL